MNRSAAGMLTVVPRAVAQTYGYRVPLKHAGLTQLIENGAMKILERTQVLSVGGNRIYTGAGNDRIRVTSNVTIAVAYPPRKLEITRKIHFPADLDGGFEFVLRPGVPEPDGSPGGASYTR